MTYQFGFIHNQTGMRGLLREIRKVDGDKQCQLLMW